MPRPGFETWRRRARAAARSTLSHTCTPAHQAVENEDAETLAQLLAQGVDPDEVCHDMTLLTHAIDAEGDGALQSRRGR